MGTRSKTFDFEIHAHVGDMYLLLASCFVVRHLECVHTGTNSHNGRLL